MISFKQFFESLSLEDDKKIFQWAKKNKSRLTKMIKDGTTVKDIMKFFEKENPEKYKELLKKAGNEQELAKSFWSEVKDIFYYDKKEDLFKLLKKIKPKRLYITALETSRDQFDLSFYINTNKFMDTLNQIFVILTFKLSDDVQEICKELDKMGIKYEIIGFHYNCK